MAEMSMQERYDDIRNISGLSEDVIRRVLKATKQSCAKSLRTGHRATIPGICTITPEQRSRITIGCKTQNYIKLKVKPSSALESELDGLTEFESDSIEEETSGIELLNIRGNSEIRTKQISALL